MKKKSTIKAENTKIEDPIKESETKEDGGNKPKATNTKLIIQRAQSCKTPSLFRISIDNLNEENKEIIDKLWDWGCVFTVASLDNSFLAKANFEYMNRSYSMGRYFYVSNQNEIYRNPCELLVLCKENYDSSNSFSFAQETIKYYKD